MLEKCVSAITGPFLVTPLFGLWVIAVYSNTLNNFLIWSATFILFVVLLPFVYIYQGVKKGDFSDLHVAVRKQRGKPFLIAIFGSLLLACAYYLEQVPREIFSLSIVMLTNGAIFYGVTKLWKISVHTAAFFGAVLVISLLVSWYAAILLIVLSLIIWSRIKRDRHSFWQTIVPIILVAVTTVAILGLFGVIKTL